ncbi:MAG: 1-deoxy-D-xylulose-5-phosphate synthase [Candidatus Cloacimonetes bacterium]|nr:1-deoxy-D-xylulose-5-phosphate synthase [Candidatus Cloacimonadota bacterium]
MILEKIRSASVIRDLSPQELTLLAKEIRKRIVDVVSLNGGHIAPSLGTVELTLALLTVFDPLKDRVVWDVGHQSYAWKILTGRNERFGTLRTLNGISGFTNRDESPCDAFSTGHSSTSVSAALGLACARDLQRESGFSIAVIGDGALTGGMSFEALNHAGHLQKNKFLVILNDNAMSISQNVGGLQKYMARMMASRPYNTLKQQIWDLSGTLPDNLRRRFILGAQKLEESMMNILVPNIIFEDLGFKYVGPIDGHDTALLSSILRRIQRHMVGPVLLHVVTQKGRGYVPAENDSSSFHGVGPFDANSGKQVCSGRESWSEVFGRSLVRLAETDPKIVAITAAMATGTGLTGFEQKFPKRFFDVGIAEQHAVTLAAGMACKGVKPFVAIYSTFLQRALDQVIHDVALPRLPVVLCIDRAGLVGEDGATHHGAFDVSLLAAIPNLIILSPSTAEELDAMLKFASAWQEGPVAIRYPRGTAVCSGQPLTDFAPGRAEILHEGKDITLITDGGARPVAEQTRELLLQAGFDPWLVNLRSLKPLDTELLGRLGDNCSHIFTFETNAAIGGTGARIAQLLAAKSCRVHNFGYPDSFVTHGKTDQLNELIGFTPARLAQEILKLLKA